MNQPPPPPPPRLPSTIGAGKAVIGVVIAFVVGVAIGMNVEETETTTTNGSQPIAEDTETPEPEPEPTEPESEPEGEFTLASCDLQLSTSGSNQLVGSTQLQNTGDVSATIRVKFSWQLGDGSWIRAKPKTVEVAAGAEELVFFKTPASSDQTSLFQSHPGYNDGSNCKTDATIG